MEKISEKTILNAKSSENYIRYLLVKTSIAG